jgi:hypothetical protein
MEMPSGSRYMPSCKAIVVLGSTDSSAALKAPSAGTIHTDNPFGMISNLIRSTCHFQVKDTGILSWAVEQT